MLLSKLSKVCFDFWLQALLRWLMQGYVALSLFSSGLANAAAEAAAASELTATRRETSDFHPSNCTNLLPFRKILRPKLINKLRAEPIPGNAFPHVIDKVTYISILSTPYNLLTYHMKNRD